MSDSVVIEIIRKIISRLSSRAAYITFVIAIAIIITVLFIYIKLPYQINTIGQIQPAQKWIITSGPDGQLIASIINYKTGVSDGYRVSQFAREGTMNLQFHHNVMSGDYIHADDTVAMIYSSETNERLALLQGELTAMRASLIVSTKGEKEPIIQGFEATLIHAREKAANQERIFERQKALYQRQLITQEEYDIAENENRLLAIEVDIARTKLEAARTGSKPEEIEYLKTEIAALTDQLNALEQRIASFSIVSPISGNISRVYSPDTLMIVSDVSEYVVLISIQCSESQYVMPGQDVQIDSEGKNGIVPGHMVLMDAATHFINRQQSCMGTAMIDSGPSNITLGLIGRCTIRCEEITLAEYVRRLLKFI
jgi:hypothetical protein